MKQTVQFHWEPTPEQRKAIREGENIYIDWVPSPEQRKAIAEGADIFIFEAPEKYSFLHRAPWERIPIKPRRALKM